MSTKLIRKRRVTQKLTYLFPVVTVSRSNKNVVAQVIEPDTRKVVFTATSFKLSKVTKSEKSKSVGEQVAAYLKQNNMPQVVFNRNGYLYHGRVKAIAESIRESGIVI
jgi:large subunit ribosomal protein L18